MELEVGNIYNVDFTTTGGYRLFLKFLEFDGEYITSNYSETLFVFKNQTNDFISIEAKRIVKVILENRKPP